MFATRQLNRILPALCAALLILGTLESGAAAQLQIPSRTTRDLGQPSNQTRQFYVPPTTNQAQPRTARSTRPVQPQRFGQRSTPTRSFTPATRAAFPTRRPTQQVTQSTAILPPDPNVQQSTTLQPGGNSNPVPGIKSTVKVDVDPETGIITLVGSNPEDVRLVQKAIAELSANAASSQPTSQSISLQNVQSTAIAESLQELYDANYASGTGRATITAIESPNALLVVGQLEAVEVVRTLVQTIDVDLGAKADNDFRTFKLIHIAAADAKVRLDAYFGQAPDQGAGDNQLPSSPVTTIVDFRSNSLIVRGAPQLLERAAQIIQDIDVDETPSVNVVKVIPLRNTLASDMAIVLQDAINGQQANAGQGLNPNQTVPPVQPPDDNVSPEQSRLRSAMLLLRSANGDGVDILGGIMFDVRVTAEQNSNSLIVTGPENSMDLIEALVRQLDTLPTAETQIKVFQIINGDAQTLLDMLENLFNGGQDAAAAPGQAPTQNQLPLQGVSATDGGTLVNMRFAVDPRTNTIIASGPVGDLQVVEDLLNRLDEADVNQRQMFVYRLSNAPALDISDAINTWLTTRGTVNDEDPRLLGGVNQTNREVIVVPEVVSNSLIISALPEYYAELQQVIQALDRRPPLVKVKVMIAEVNLDALEEFGVDLGIQDSLLFNRGTAIGAGGAITDGSIGFPFNQADIGNVNAFRPESLAGQALSNLATGRINADAGFGGLVLSAGSDSINILIRALKDKQCVRVLSKPHIVTLENLQGRIAAISDVPRIAGTTQTNVGVTNNVAFEEVGLILEITPRVSPDGTIVMAVNVEKSSLGPAGTGIPISVAADGTTINAPQIFRTQAQTTVMARSGQTAVFSGLVTEDKSNVVRGIPILSDIPVLGNLFKFEQDSAARSELLIVMTPYLVNDEAALEKQNRDEIDRMHWCIDDVAEIYGNTDYDGGQTTVSEPETFYPDYDPRGVYPDAQLDNGFTPDAPFSSQQAPAGSQTRSVPAGSHTRSAPAGSQTRSNPPQNSFGRLRQASAQLKSKFRPNALRESFNEQAARTGTDTIRY